MSDNDQGSEQAQALLKASLISDPHLREIAIGSALEGFPGVLWRLIGKTDHREVEKFIKSEMVRGTPMETIMDVISTQIASIALIMAGHVQRNQMRRCAQQIMTKSVELLERDIAELIEAKKDAGILRNNLRLVPGSNQETT